MLLHASCVALGGKGVLLTGPAGAGKSDLALRLIEGGAMLVSDDQTLLIRREDGVLFATPPDVLAGLIEIRHIGLMKMPFAPATTVALYVELTAEGEHLDRLPEPDSVFLLDQSVQRLRLPAFAASTPAKIRAALTLKRHDD